MPLAWFILGTKKLVPQPEPRASARKEMVVGVFCGGPELSSGKWFASRLNNLQK